VSISAAVARGAGEFEGNGAFDQDERVRSRRLGLAGAGRFHQEIGPK
jgi:hypothetical protein